MDQRQTSQAKAWPFTVDMKSKSFMPGCYTIIIGLTWYPRHINASWSVPSNGNLSVLNFGNPATSRFVGYTQVAMFQQENQTVCVSY